MSRLVRFQATFMVAAILVIVGAVMMWGPGRTGAEPATPPSAKKASAPQHTEPATSSPSVFKICKGQTYALCFTASCEVFDGVAYCQCDQKSGDSISLPLHLGKGQDVCTVNAAGAGNGYMVSTFSLPQSVVAPHGNRAIYTCEGTNADGDYAQCDGGLCFTSTEGTTFLGQRVPKGQLICSCPITVPGGNQKMQAFQIVGPYPCQKSFFKYCNSATANQNNGSTIYVGAPAGSARLMTKELDGSVPTLNECRP